MRQVTAFIHLHHITLVVHRNGVHTVTFHWLYFAFFCWRFRCAG
ncbi:Uncharacterised protein [Vibrio cholerae]|nr:Uncharacterised protein [Vibrio cholerae]